MPIITLTTDYGTRDHFVAAMKGVMLVHAPGAVIVDVTHSIAPFDIAHAAFVLRQTLPWYPPGTVHVVVVDPRVGSPRRILLAQYARQFVLAPDNGVLTLVHRELRAEALHVVEDRRHFLRGVSATFHGRDIFAPVAAYLACGARPREFGPTTDRLEMLPVAHKAVFRDGVWEGVVLYVDHFGNLITNVQAQQVPILAAGGGAGYAVHVGGVSVGPIRAAFFEVPVGEPVCYFGSSGYLEIAVNQGRAVDRFGRDETFSVRRISP